jgi:hypothetical protein
VAPKQTRAGWRFSAFLKFFEKKFFEKGLDSVSRKCIIGIGFGGPARVIGDIGEMQIHLSHSGKSFDEVLVRTSGLTVFILR